MRPRKSNRPTQVATVTALVRRLSQAFQRPVGSVSTQIITNTVHQSQNDMHHQAILSLFCFDHTQPILCSTLALLFECREESGNFFCFTTDIRTWRIEPCTILASLQFWWSSRKMGRAAAVGEFLTELRSNSVHSTYCCVCVSIVSIQILRHL